MVSQGQKSPMVPLAPPVNPVPLPAQMSPVKPVLPPSHESDVSYALMTQTDIDVERDKRARYQEWKEDVTKEGGVNTAESQPGKAVGVGSAFWDSLSTFRTDTGTEATTIVQQRRMAREALLYPRPGIVGGPNSSSSSLPPIQAINMPAPSGSAAARPARSPPVPLLAHPPQSMLAPAPPSNAVAKHISLAPGDPVYPAPSPKSTRAQRDAYLSSALDLPFDILRQRHVESPAASDTSSKPSNRRLASLLGMSKSKERLVSNHRGVSEAQIPRMDDSPRGSIGLGPNEPKTPLGRSVTVSPRLETATAKTDQLERTRKSPLVGPSQHAEVTKSKSANEAQSTRQMGSRTSQRSARPVQGDQGDQTSADPPRSLGSNRSQRKDPSSSRDQVEAPLRRYASNQHLTVPGVPEIPVEVPSLGSQASRRSKKTVKSRSRENLDGEIALTRRVADNYQPKQSTLQPTSQTREPPATEARSVQRQRSHDGSNLKAANIEVSAVDVSSNDPKASVAEHAKAQSSSAPVLSQPGSTSQLRGPRSTSIPNPTPSAPAQAGNGSIALAGGISAPPTALPHRQQLPLPRSSLTPSHSFTKDRSADGIGRKQRDPSTANLSAHFQPASYPLPKSETNPSITTSPAQQAPSIPVTLEKTGTLSRHVSQKPEQPRSRSKTSGNQSQRSSGETKGHGEDPPTVILHESTPSLEPPVPLVTAPPHGPDKRLPAPPPPSSVPIDAPSPMSELSEPNDVSFEVPSGRHRLRVSLAWIRNRDGRSRRNQARSAQPYPSSPLSEVPPTPPPKSPPSVIRRLRDSLVIQPDSRRRRHDIHHPRSGVVDEVRDTKYPSASNSSNSKHHPRHRETIDASEEDLSRMRADLERRERERDEELERKGSIGRQEGTYLTPWPQAIGPLYPPISPLRPGIGPWAYPQPGPLGPWNKPGMGAPRSQMGVPLYRTASRNPPPSPPRPPSIEPPSERNSPPAMPRPLPMGQGMGFGNQFGSFNRLPGSAPRSVANQFHGAQFVGQDRQGQNGRGFWKKMFNRPRMTRENGNNDDGPVLDWQNGVDRGRPPPTAPRSLADGQSTWFDQSSRYPPPRRYGNGFAQLFGGRDNRPLEPDPRRFPSRQAEPREDRMGVNPARGFGLYTWDRKPDLERRRVVQMERIRIKEERRRAKAERRNRREMRSRSDRPTNTTQFGPQVRNTAARPGLNPFDLLGMGNAPRIAGFRIRGRDERTRVPAERPVAQRGRSEGMVRTWVTGVRKERTTIGPPRAPREGDVAVDRGRKLSKKWRNRLPNRCRGVQ